MTNTKTDAVVPNVPEHELANHFAYLDRLRESGATNMYGASPYLGLDRELDEDRARDVLLSWMRTFNRTDSPEVRARAALTAGQES